MNKVLYVFDFEKLDDFKLQFASRNFVSIALIFNLAPNIDDINDLDDDFIDNCIIDITALGFENGYYKLFIERYLYALIETFESVEFSINSITRDTFLEKFPYIFDETNEEYLLIDEENRGGEDVIPIDKINIAPISLLLYRQSLIEELLEKHQIVSIGSFFACTDSINYKFNGEVIEDILSEKDVHYIDITQMVHTFALRKDLILAFEIILRQIQNKKHDIQFLISEDMEEELKKYLPFTFKKNNEFFDSNGEEETCGCETELSLDSIVSEIIKNLTSQLKGHEDFKKDFSFNLKNLHY